MPAEELSGLTVKELRSRAEAAGVSEDAIEEARDSDEPDDAQWVRPSPHARPRVRSRTVPPCAQSPRQALPLLLLEIRGPLSPLTESEARPVRDTRAAARLC